MIKKIIIGSDHAGFEMKHSIISNLSDLEFDDIGTDSDESVDYPDYANKLVNRVKVIFIPLDSNLWYRNWNVNVC